MAFGYLVVLDVKTGSKVIAGLLLTNCIFFPFISQFGLASVFCIFT